MSVAFFDFDKTLIERNSGSLWLKHELREGRISRWTGLRAGWWLARYSLGFTDLKAILETSDGNLITHARRLEDAEYLEATKDTDGATPRTVYRLTPLGKSVFSDYLEHMEALIRATRGGASPARRPRRRSYGADPDPGASRSRPASRRARHCAAH